MRRIIAAFTTVCILLLVLLAGEAKAGDCNEMSYEKARLLMLENSTTLQLQRNVLNRARRQYRYYLMTIKNDGEYIRGDELTKLSRMRQRELTPLQMRYNCENLEENLTTSRYQAEFNLRNLFVRLYSRFKTLEARKEGLITAEKLYQSKEKAYEMGLIGDLEFEQAGQELLEQRVLTKKAEREYENAAREFNLYIGADIDNIYENVILSESPRSVQIASLETYLVRALENRSEITQIKRSLELYLLEKDIMERSRAHRIHLSVGREYDALLDNIAASEIRLEAVKVSIEQEIRDAYTQIVSAIQTRESLSSRLALEEKRLADLQRLFEKGVVSESQLQKADMLVKQMRQELNISTFNLNTMIMKLERASAAGPGYTGI